MMALMRKGWGIAVMVGALALASCGSTDDDSLVLTFVGFDGDNITQCDQINPGLAEIDISQICCDDSNPCTDVEPVTQTQVNALFQNNQKLGITINSYTVEIPGTGVGAVTNETSQFVTGKRCLNVPTRECADDADCVVGITIGSCVPSTSPVSIVLADFTTKALIGPDVQPGGKTVDIFVRFFGSDSSRAQWQAQASIPARFDNFNNCNCNLGN